MGAPRMKLLANVMGVSVFLASIAAVASTNEWGNDVLVEEGFVATATAKAPTDDSSKGSAPNAVVMVSPSDMHKACGKSQADCARFCTKKQRLPVHPAFRDTSGKCLPDPIAATTNPYAACHDIIFQTGQNGQNVVAATVLESSGLSMIKNLTRKEKKKLEACKKKYKHYLHDPAFATFVNGKKEYLKKSECKDILFKHSAAMVLAAAKMNINKGSSADNEELLQPVAPLYKQERDLFDSLLN